MIACPLAFFDGSANNLSLKKSRYKCFVISSKDNIKYDEYKKYKQAIIETCRPILFQ